MSKRFEELFEIEDPIIGEYLEWEWNADERQFIATDRTGKIYKLIPLTAEVEIEQADSEIEPEEDLED